MAESVHLPPERVAEVRRQSWSVGFATGLYGASFGALAVAAGLEIWQTCALSLLMFTGGSQFAFVGIIGSGGTLANVLVGLATSRIAVHFGASAVLLLCGALLFGCIEALIPQLAAAGVQLPQYFVLMTPYVVTLGVMVWVALARRGGQAVHDEPGALGQPYLREERR